MEERWNCQLYFNRKGEAASNIPLGFPQLADACGLAPYLSQDFMKWFEAMFNYRNFMFHGGFEWTVHSREKFTEIIEAKGWERFFTCSTSGDKPWIYYLTNETIADMPDMIGKMLDDLGRFAKDLPFELISKP
ncbi:hypothetical protein [Pararhizobium sp. PWRC1-1]|uniref:hypothetical protein n=1 Tax=Pararhizobium sp. PWRC1-1 TaxID=2804566 RepID=UPI003CF206ED